VRSSHTAAGRGRKTIGVLIVVAAVAGGYYYWTHERAGPGPGAARQAARSIPVTVVAAGQQDFPVVLTGLGTVQASFTVGIHAQVDGKLEQVLFNEGQYVNRGDVLAKIDPRLYQAAFNQAKAKKAQDDAALVALEKDLVRFKTLAAKGFQSEQNIDQQTSKVDTMKAAIAADTAAMEAARTQLDYTTITAPSDGRMGVRLIDPGNIVRASDNASIGILTRTKPIFVMFTLPASTLDDVRDAKGKGDVQVVAYDRDNKKMLSTGRLETIDNVIDPATATYKLKAIFENADEKLWPGEFVNARLQVGVMSAAVVIPNAAVQRGPNGLFTWVIKPNDTAEARPIEAGPSGDGMTVVTSGLNSGDRVVVDGQYRLQVGATVAITAAPTAAGSSS
jgi:membrane fusion protein, multidrug efflux system